MDHKKKVALKFEPTFSLSLSPLPLSFSQRADGLSLIIKELNLSLDSRDGLGLLPAGGNSLGLGDLDVGSREDDLDVG